jgi:hypothetical protein
MPGPGSYNSQSFIQPKYKQRKIKGLKTRVKGLQQSSFFSSQSTRDIDTNRSAFQGCQAGYYDVRRSLGQQSLQGGAPANFLLLKANKSAQAPFASTVQRFISTEPSTGNSSNVGK